MMDTILRLIMGGVVAAVACVSMAPSIALNIANAQNTGGGWPLIIAAVVSVVAAPFCLSSLSVLVDAKRFDLATGAVLLFCTALTFNVTNAVGLVGGERDSRREGREAKIATVTATDDRLSQVQSSLQRFRSLTKDATPAMVDAELAALRADPKYKRADKCADVTLADSSELCKQIAATEGKREAATRIIALEGEERILLAKRETLGAAPTSPDAKVSRVSQLVGLLIPISKTGDQWVGVGLDVLAAILFEVMAAILPPIAILCFWPKRGIFPITSPRKETGQSKQKKKTELKAASTAERAPVTERNSMELFAERCIVRSDGDNVKGAELYKAYCAFCETIGELPETNTLFGRTMPTLGFEKVPGRSITYRNISLQEPGQRKFSVIRGKS